MTQPARPPQVADLPPPPNGKTGWPWTEDCTPTFEDVESLPTLSIVTPSYNQAHYIEETIRSIVLQGYPKLQYIVIDGGSTDNTVDVLKKYDAWIEYWVSENDKGQTDAINKGMAQATGDIRAYLNSDDIYLPDSFAKVVHHFMQNPEADLVHGICRYIDVDSNKIGQQQGDIRTLDQAIHVWDYWWKEKQFVQPEVFWSKRIAEKVGPFNDTLYFVMDYEYWLRIIAAGGKVSTLDAETGCLRFTPEQKSNHSERVADEVLEVIQPWLWNNDLEISNRVRLQCRANWLYQFHFMKLIDDSIQSGEGKLQRWKKMVTLVAKYPLIAVSPSFIERIGHVITPGGRSDK